LEDAEATLKLSTDLSELMSGPCKQPIKATDLPWKYYQQCQQPSIMG